MADPWTVGESVDAPCGHPTHHAIPPCYPCLRIRANALQAEVERLGAVVAAYRDGVEMVAAGRGWIPPGVAREAAEALRHAEEWMGEDWCDCGVDEPGSCGLCLVRAALARLEEGDRR